MEKSIDGVLGSHLGPQVVSADETTELWRPPQYLTMFTVKSIEKTKTD